VTVLEMLAALEHPNDDLTLYDICRRNAGWAIMWHSQEKGPDEFVPHPMPSLAEKGLAKLTDSWRRGLFVLAYHPTFEAMVAAEYARLFPASTCPHGCPGWCALCAGAPPREGEG
jgi:hypothetical protein